MILVYSDRNSPRLAYSLDLVLHSMLGLDYTLTHQPEKFHVEKGPKIAYSSNPATFDNGIILKATELLFEKGIKDQNIAIGQFGELKTLFRTSKRYNLPYDIFAAVFYLVTRYEEYLPHRSDHFDRFLHTESIAWKEGFLETAIVDRWVDQLRQLLNSHWPELKLDKPTYRFLPTIDIDQLYAYREKSWVRMLGGLMSSLYKRNGKQFIERVKVLTGQENDPFDTYSWLNQQHSRFSLKPVYFILMGNYGGPDKAHNPSNEHFREHIRTLADRNDIGLHPSVRSTAEQTLIDREKSILEAILNRPVSWSRQHFLKLRLPQTYQQLSKRDFTADFSMGYAAAPGFRSGTAMPHFFYDLDHEQPLRLKIYPTVVMDVSLRVYMGLEPEAAKAKIRQLITECKEVGGCFVSLWHNSSFSVPDGWQGWDNVYTFLLEEAQPWK
jgi:hypothetical protein